MGGLSFFKRADDALSPTQQAAIAAIRSGKPVVYRVKFTNGVVSTTTGSDLFSFESVFHNVSWR
jgi:hypothetical protein